MQKNKFNVKLFVLLPLVLAITIFLWAVPTSFYGIEFLTATQQRVIEKEESETTSIIYKGEESVFYPITDSGWDCPEPIKATAVNAEFLEYLWQTYGTMWYTDEDSPEYAYDYMMLLKNIRERYDVWEHILLDYWKTAYPDHWDENLEARLNLTRPAFEKSKAIFDSNVADNVK